MTDAQTLINTLAAQIANQKRARELGRANVVAEYKVAIQDTLGKLEALGYDRLECLEACS
jgi:hypothetical protein